MNIPSGVLHRGGHRKELNMNDKIQAAIDALNAIDIEKMSTEQIRNLRNEMIYMLARLANELLVRSED